MLTLIIVPTRGRMPTDTSQFLPLKPVDFILLLALVEEEQHGYALAREIDERTDGVIRFEPGNLYRVIKRLVDDGLVEVSERRPAPELDDERRRYYRLTALGARVAAAEARRLRVLLSSRTVRALAPLAGPA
jgi:DNA-binding PadR family transcriptional regulator